MNRKRRAAMIVAAVLSAFAYLGIAAGSPASAFLGESAKWGDIELK
jgi:hypothetical protein